MKRFKKSPCRRFFSCPFTIFSTAERKISCKQQLIKMHSPLQYSLWVTIISVPLCRKVIPIPGAIVRTPERNSKDHAIAMGIAMSLSVRKRKPRRLALTEHRKSTNGQGTSWPIFLHRKFLQNNFLRPLWLLQTTGRKNWF